MSFDQDEFLDKHIPFWTNTSLIAFKIWSCSIVRCK